VRRNDIARRGRLTKSSFLFLPRENARRFTTSETNARYHPAPSISSAHHRTALSPMTRAIHSFMNCDSRSG
jgi:hypothetical protein